MKRRIKNKIAKRNNIENISLAERNKYITNRRKLVNEFNLNMKRVNRKLTRIRREYGALQYSSKNLIEQITARKDLKRSYNIKTGRIQIRKSLSNDDLKSLNKLMSNFLKDKTSTISGIKNRRESARLGLKQLMGDVDREISDSDIDAFARTFQNADFRWLMRYGMDESEFVSMVQEAISNRWTEGYFLETIIDYIGIIPDLDMKDDLIDLYNKYVRGNYFGL